MSSPAAASPGLGAAAAPIGAGGRDLNGVTRCRFIIKRTNRRHNARARVYREPITGITRQAVGNGIVC